MLSAIYAEIIYAECQLCWVSFMLSVIYVECHLWWVSFMLSVIYAKCHLCWVSFILSAIYAECHLCWESFMLSVIHAECHLRWVLLICPLFYASHLLSVANKPTMLSVVMLIGLAPRVVFTKLMSIKCLSADCFSAKRSVTQKCYSTFYETLWKIHAVSCLLCFVVYCTLTITCNKLVFFFFFHCIPLPP